MVYRVLAFQTGETKILPLGAFEDKQEAVRASHARQAAISLILNDGRVRVRTPESVSPEDMPLRAVIGDIGIVGVSHTVTEVDIQGKSAIVIPELVLPQERRH